MLAFKPAFRSITVGTPFAIGSLFLNGEQGAWYDPSDLSTLFQDAAGTTPVTADGDPVGLMLDKSGNGNHARQATATARPLYKTSGGLHWLAFDDVDDIITAEVLFLGVFDYGMGYVPSGATSFILYHRQPLTTGGWVGIGTAGSTATVLDDLAGDQNSIYFDNVLSGATTRGGQWGLAQTARSAISNYNLTSAVNNSVLSIGRYPSFSVVGPFHGGIIREGTATSAQRSAMSKWLAGKAGRAI